MPPVRVIAAPPEAGVGPRVELWVGDEIEAASLMLALDSAARQIAGY